MGIDRKVDHTPSFFLSAFPGGGRGTGLPRTWGPILRSEILLHPPKPRRRSRDRFTDAELDRLRRATAHSPRDFGLLLFFLHTGCRSGAACNLRVADVIDEGPPPVARAVGRVEEQASF
jgi:integrase